ncbi:hypothetical protein [Kribbella swartbergensis]
MGLLDPSSAEYRVVAGIIASAHRRVGATRSHRWNGDIGVLPTLSRQRSQADLDGTIHLHPRNVIGPLMRAHGGAGGRWWYPRAARDAAYNVIYEALRQSSKPSVRPTDYDAGKPLDGGLALNARTLDQSLAEQRTYEIAEAVLGDNGMAQVYVEDPPEAAGLGGHGLSSGMVTPFRVNPRATTATAGVRGFVDGLAAATGRGRDEVFDRLITEAKGSRWSLALQLVADPEVFSRLSSEQRSSAYSEASRHAAQEWSRLSSFRSITISTVEAAEQWGYSIGLETADTVVKQANGLPTPVTAEPAQALRAPAGNRELSPNDVLGAQAPLTGVKRPESAPAAGTSSSAPAERRAQQLDK